MRAWQSASGLGTLPRRSRTSPSISGPCDCKRFRSFTPLRGAITGSARDVTLGRRSRIKGFRAPIDLECASRQSVPKVLGTLRTLYRDLPGGHGSKPSYWRVRDWAVHLRGEGTAYLRRASTIGNRTGELGESNGMTRESNRERTM